MQKLSCIFAFCLFVLSFFFPQQLLAAGNTFYVAGSGCSDSNSGSITQPFCTISKGLSSTQPGDTLMLRAGTYPNFEITKSGASGNYLTIQAYNNEHVSITGGASTIRFTAASYIQIKGLDISGANGSYGAGVLFKSSSNNNRIEGNVIHDNIGPNTHGVIIDSSAYNKILNNTVYNNYSVGLKIQGTSTGNELTGNTVYGNVGDPPNSDGIAVSGETATNTLIQGNDVYSNGDDGIDTWSSNHHTIIGNRSHDNGLGGDGNGFKMGGTATGGSNTIIGNMSYNNKRDGFDSNHSGNNTYINNVAYGNGSVGYQDGEGKFAPCTVSSCKTTYIDNIGYNNASANFNASDFTAVSHNNLWYMDNGGLGISYLGSSQGTLSAFYSASGSRLDNPNAGTLSSLSSNPLFIGASTGDFRLNFGSPAINAGDPANPGHLTVIGRPDIGALESGVTSTPAPTTAPTGSAKPGDINADGKVDIIDIGILIDNYGKASSAYPKADVNSDGSINIIDIGLVIDGYGK